jgi:hypothetical protein
MYIYGSILSSEQARLDGQGKGSMTFTLSHPLPLINMQIKFDRSN